MCPTADAGTWVVIKGATSATYTPVALDNGDCLLVEASYLDGFYDVGDNDDGTMFAKSAAMVLDGKVQQAAENTSPKFASARMMRYVPEDAAVATDDAMGARVGAAVAAKDTDARSYTLGGTDAGSFDIGLTDGQITVGAKAKLDHETKPTLSVTVTATDPHDATDTATVTIMVTDVDEAPELSDKNDSMAMSMQTINDYKENGTDPVLTLTASDPEGAMPVVWSILDAHDGEQDIPGEDGTDNVGINDIADRDLFKISQDGEDGVLEFKAKPNFDDPGDAGDNNDYQCSGTGLRRRDDEYPQLVQGDRQRHRRGRGRVDKAAPDGARCDVTLLQPQVGVGITAHSLMDPDGPATINNPAYKWYRTSSRTSMGTAIVDDADAAEITTPTYTPKATTGNSDVGKYLRVVATYTDGRAAATRPPRQSRNTRRLTASPPTQPLSSLRPALRDRCRRSRLRARLSAGR